MATFPSLNSFIQNQQFEILFKLHALSNGKVIYPLVIIEANKYICIAALDIIPLRHFGMILS